ncbi:hypothetical protein HZ326_27267 [Fusarium oxysporum f. sp. albedinis]|nr:hypothetical protein HZ326_27267 [Fusarium oxysporum f. sp. albedinis]
MSEELVVATTPVARVRVLAFNRPAKRNALSQKLITIFLEHLQEASRDNGLADGRAAGADISEISALEAQAARSCRYLAGLCTGMRAVCKPMIAPVEGMALGGGFVDLMCDLGFAAEGCDFGLPEVTIGPPPGAGARTGWRSIPRPPSTYPWHGVYYARKNESHRASRYAKPFTILRIDPVYTKENPTSLFKSFPFET